MQGSFYSNCAVLTYEVDGERSLVSENSLITELECDDWFEIICPTTFISGSEVIFEGRVGRISSLGERFAEVIFDGELRQVKLTKLSTVAKHDKTIIRGNTTMSERLKEMCWKGRGKIVVNGENSSLTFHVRLISSLPYPVVFDSVKIHDRGFQDQPPMFHSMARSVSKRDYGDETSMASYQANDIIDEVTHTLEGPITLNSMLSIPVVNMEMNISPSLMYNFLNNYSFVRVYGKYEGEIYRGNYTVVVPEYNIVQSCAINPNTQKSFTLNLTDSHGPYSVTQERKDQSNDGYYHSGSITNRSSKKIFVYFVTPYYTDYTYSPDGGNRLIDSGEIYWSITLSPGRTKNYAFNASRVVDSKYLN